MPRLAARLLAAVLVTLTLLGATATSASAFTPPVESVGVDPAPFPDPAVDGNCRVSFSWTPLKTGVDHYQYVVTGDKLPLTDGWTRQESSTTLTRTLAKSVAPGHGLWLTLTAVFTDGSRSSTIQFGHASYSC